jgi:AmmeMemoRadiSam system protein B/AmmeMemoRadiSam system protein A
MVFSRKPLPGSVRRPAVAGLFYAEERAALARDVERLLAGAASPVPRPSTPKALVVPHAGYVYSGPVAASAYALLRGARGAVRRVVLLGPCHRFPVRGVALPGVAAFDTPLGRVPLDGQAVAALAGMPQVEVSGPAHALEHSLEVQLPFLQTVLGEFTLVPLAVGSVSPGAVAEVIERLWGGPETLVVVSSDLSHYLDYAAAQEIDRATVDAIVGLRDEIDHEQACGATPVAGLVHAARRQGLVPQLLDLRNSGDTAGDRDRVVGYASIAFWAEGQDAYGEGQGRELLSVARASVVSAVGGPRGLPSRAEWLQAERASFVTLTRGGELRGCIGTLTASRPLVEDVAANARAAALRDPRFPPVGVHELDELRIEVSVVSPLVPVPFDDEAELFAAIEPGRDGLALDCGGRHATFLPQVWSALPEPARFVAELQRKAGVPEGTPLKRCEISRYRVVKWREEDSW